VLIVAALALQGACASPEQVPFPHLLGGSGGDATTSGGTGGAGAGGVPAGGAGAGGVPTTGGGGAATGGGGAGGGVSAGTGGTTTDSCPDDPLKTDPGACGCGMPDTDTDGDGTPDCKDECPAVATKTKAGCGCMYTADEDTACAGLKAGLAHRYAFDDTGTTIKDSKGTADAAAVNMTLAGTGDLNFTTGDQYADLPNNLVSKLTNVTLEAFVTWQGGAVWQRIFDFGEDTSGVENNRSSGRSYIFVSPHGSGNFVRAVFKKATTAEVVIDSTPSLTIGDQAEVALVIDDDHDLMSLYVNGAPVGSQSLTDHLSDVNDINNWLGRSQFATDPAFVGTMQEFRIYNVALSAVQLAFSQKKGPDGAYLVK